MADAAISGGLHRVETVMGIPVGVDVRDDGVDPAALDRAFAHLREADDAFSPYRAASDVSRLDAGTLALAGARPDVRAVLARCERLRALVPDLAERDVFVAGPTPMVRAARAGLREAGVAARQISSEAFG